MFNGRKKNIHNEGRSVRPSIVTDELRSKTEENNQYDRHFAIDRLMKLKDL